MLAIIEAIEAKAAEENKNQRYETFGESSNMNVEHPFEGALNPSNVGFPDHTFLFSDDPSSYNLVVVKSQNSMIVEQQITPLTTLVNNRQTHISPQQTPHSTPKHTFSKSPSPQQTNSQPDPPIVEPHNSLVIESVLPSPPTHNQTQNPVHTTFTSRTHIDNPSTSNTHINTPLTSYTHTNIPSTSKYYIDIPFTSTREVVIKTSF